MAFFLFISQEFISQQGYVFSRNAKVLEFLYNNIVVQTFSLLWKIKGVINFFALWSYAK